MDLVLPESGPPFYGLDLGIYSMIIHCYYTTRVVLVCSVLKEIAPN